MITTQVYCCLVPGAWWCGNGAPNMRGEVWKSMVAELLAIERRLKKGSDSKTDAAAYARCCQVLEGTVRGAAAWSTDLKDAGRKCQAGEVAAVRVASVPYCEAMAELRDATTDTRLGATIHPPDLAQALLAQISSLTQSKRNDTDKLHEIIQVLQKAIDCKAGVVILQSPWIENSGASPGPRSCSPKPTPPPVISLSDIEIDASGPEYLQMITLLQRQLERVRDTALSVNFSNVAHRVIAEVLHQHVFVTGAQNVPATNVGVIYADGSEAAPFPLACLTKESQLEQRVRQDGNPLRIGLISMRHLAIDREIAYYWFRNTQVSQCRRLSEADAQCYEETRTQLAAALSDPQIQDLVIYLYHTGWVPVVLGFYRALVEAIPVWRKQGKLLAVTPMFFDGPDGYVQGEVWC